MAGQGSEGITSGRFDLDDVRSIVCQEHGHYGASNAPGQIKNVDTFQYAWHVVRSLHSMRRLELASMDELSNRDARIRTGREGWRRALSSVTIGTGPVTAPSSPTLP